MCFFHKYICQYLWGTFSLDWIVITIGLILNWAAAINYAVDASKQYKANKAKTANAEKANEENTAEENKQTESVTEGNAEKETKE